MTPPIDQEKLKEMLQLSGLILQPNPSEGFVFRGILVKQNAFRVEVLDDERAVVSMEEFSIPLIGALNKVIGYRAVIRYQRLKDGLVVVEWKKNEWHVRWDELVKSGKVRKLELVQ